MTKRHALCVGINKYPHAPLNGCVNDAINWADNLRTVGYSVEVLLDEHATKAAVLTSLEQLLREARFGDRVVLTYSGHGSWIPDTDGDEVDGRDEVLCAYDYESGGLISDDELYAVMQNRRFGVRVYIMSDSCFSGTMTRFVGAPPSDGSPRFMPPANFLTPEQLPAARRAESLPSRAIGNRPGAALMSGCGEDEYSYDAWIDGKPQGAFSATAIHSYVPGISLSRWHAAVRKVLPSSSYPQTPQLQASLWQRTWGL